MKYLLIILITFLSCTEVHVTKVVHSKIFEHTEASFTSRAWNSYIIVFEDGSYAYVNVGEYQIIDVGDTLTLSTRNIRGN